MIRQPTDKTTLLEFYRQLMSGTSVIDGKELACTFAVADGASKLFEHGLGRPWRGAWVIGNTQASTVVARTGDPGTPSGLLNPDKVSVFLSAAADVTVRVWVF